MQLVLSIVAITFLRFCTALFTGDKTVYGELTFDCGPVIFRDLAVKNAVDEAMKRFGKGLKYPMLYNGPLYDATLKYMIWPILENGNLYNSYVTKGIFYLVLDRSGSVVDIITILSNNQEAKCIRRDQLFQRPLTKKPEEVTGFDCGQDFLEDSIVSQNLKWARIKLGAGNAFPAQFTGNLFNPKFQYFIWPISKRNIAGTSGKSIKSPHYIVITSFRKFVGVIARLKTGDSFIECQSGIRLAKNLRLSEMETDSYTEYGFQCGHKFFEKSYLHKCLTTAAAPTRNGKINRYPESFNSPAFPESVLIWPVLPDKKVYKTGPTGKYFLVINRNFKLLTVIVKDKGEIHRCHERTRNLEKTLPETADFICDTQVFKSNWLEETAKVACSKMNGVKKMYPASYEGPDFDVPGPYYTYPLFFGKMYTRESIEQGDYRLVVSSECKVAGALVIRDVKFEKCRRMIDDSIPGGESSEEIGEYIYKFD